VISPRHAILVTPPQLTRDSPLTIFMISIGAVVALISSLPPPCSWQIGRIYASLIHGYDLGIPSGTQLVGALDLSTVPVDALVMWHSMVCSKCLHVKNSIKHLWRFVLLGISPSHPPRPLPPLLLLSSQTVGEHDCVWDASQKVTPHPSASGEIQHPPSPQRNYSPDEILPSVDADPSTPSLRHIHHPRGRR
jgi:hypothetical protein